MKRGTKVSHFVKKKLNNIFLFYSSFGRKNKDFWTNFNSHVTQNECHMGEGGGSKIDQKSVEHIIWMTHYCIWSLKDFPFYFSREVWSKENVSWLESGTEVEYAPAKSYFFREDLSVGPESQKLTLLNIPMIVSSSIIINIFYWISPIEGSLCDKVWLVQLVPST